MGNVEHLLEQRGDFIRFSSYGYAENSEVVRLRYKIIAVTAQYYPRNMQPWYWRYVNGKG